jgi:S-DNA-T family DNA segregation ATPase FtsK/SpoIIIE
MPNIKGRPAGTGKSSSNGNGMNGFSKALGLCLITMGFVLSLGSYQAEDPSFSSFSSTWKAPQNVLGYLGSWTADILLQIFGWSAWIIPSLLAIAMTRWLMAENPKSRTILGPRWFGALALLISASCLFLDLIGSQGVTKTFPPQGVVGIMISSATEPLMGVIGSFLLTATLVWAFCLVWWEDLPEKFVTIALFALQFTREQLQTLKLPDLPVDKLQNFFTKIKFHFFNKSEKELTDQTRPKESLLQTQGSEILAEPQLNLADSNSPSPSSQPLIRSGFETPPAVLEKTNRPNHTLQRTKNSHPIQWILPPLSLLELPKKKSKGPSHDQLLETARKITHALKSFEVDGEIVEITPGPIITMYEFQPGPGVRIQKIMATSTDLAMALGAPSVRIVAPIPGKSVAGIEVPNLDKEDILLRDVYEQTLEKAKSMRLPLVLGKDGEGRPMCEDLSRMPHLLIGGATSMGKSVLVNSLLTSLMCRFTPESLRLIIVDPKLVEFKAFEDIPHLLLPIVNDPQDASQALKWAVSETKRRYLVMQKYSSKNLEAYNQKIAAGDFKLEEGTTPEKFPYIVIIIDELAELMLTAKKDVEQSIVRLTQLARAAGLHLIMSTQRPSADVVTGLIKSNCPSRAALRVASSMDSRIILDCTGAEQLLGRGDMFFTNTGPMGLRRLQSCYVSDPEIEKVCGFWRNQGEPEYKDEILAPEPDIENLTQEENDSLDSLFSEVLSFAREKGKISTSLIQRRFQIGYSRAARIMEQLEERGIVGDQQAAGKARDVLA